MMMMIVFAVMIFDQSLSSSYHQSFCVGSTPIEPIAQELSQHKKNIDEIQQYLQLPQYKQSLHEQLQEAGALMNILSDRIAELNSNMNAHAYKVQSVEQVIKELEVRIKLVENNKEKVDGLIHHCDLHGTDFFNMKEVCISLSSLISLVTGHQHHHENNNDDDDKNNYRNYYIDGDDKRNRGLTSKKDYSTLSVVRRISSLEITSSKWIDTIIQLSDKVSEVKQAIKVMNNSRSVYPSSSYLTSSSSSSVTTTATANRGAPIRIYDDCGSGGTTASTCIQRNGSDGSRPTLKKVTINDVTTDKLTSTTASATAHPPPPPATVFVDSSHPNIADDSSYNIDDSSYIGVDFERALDKIFPSDEDRQADLVPVHPVVRLSSFSSSSGSSSGTSKILPLMTTTSRANKIIDSSNNNDNDNTKVGSTSSSRSRMDEERYAAALSGYGVTSSLGYGVTDLNRVDVRLQELKNEKQRLRDLLVSSIEDM